MPLTLALALALAFAPQIPNVAPPGSTGLATRRVPPPPTVTYAPYPNGGRVQQLGLLHSEGLETFGLFRPGQLPQGTPTLRPLLVLFHIYGGDGDGELEAYTEFSDEADLRYWYILAPDQDVPFLGFDPVGSSLRRKTYGNDDADARLALTLRFVLERYPIDRTRIYGVGFSMGGGDLVSYAAQHLDPTQGAFAAIATNAGTLCLTEEYWNSTQPYALERAIGGGAAPTPGGTNVFDYERASSLLYVDPFASSVLDLGRRQPASNLLATPVQAWIDLREPSQHLVRFTDDLELLLTPGGNFQRHDVLGAPTNSPHWWGTFDYMAVCDTFATQQLVVPKVRDLVFARDARYGDVTVQRVDRRAFGELRHDFTGIGLPGGLDRAVLIDAANVASASIDANVLGLGASGGGYELEVEGNPARPWVLAVESVLAPTQVLRDGVDVTANQNTLWAYDPAARMLRVIADQAVTHVYTIL